MNKVTSYLKNIGKSIGYSSIDVAKNLIPEVDDFIDTNEEIFKSIYATVSHSKKSMNYGRKLAQDSQLYKDIDKGIKNVISDIKTGNFYNKERSQRMVDAAGESLAGGFADFGEDEDINFDDFNFDDDDDFSFDDEETSSKSTKSMSITKGDMYVADNITKSGNLSAQLISKTVANTSSSIIKANVATTNMMMAQNVELMAGLRTSISGLHESINGLLSFANNEVRTQITNETKYFETTTSLMQENNAILKEMLEMQRNMYKAEIEKSKANDQFSNVFTAGTMDIKEYMKAVFKNTKSLDPTGTIDMILGSSEEGGINFVEQMFANPLGAVMTGLVASQMPKSLAKSIAGLSKTLGSVIPVMIARLNKWKNDDVGGWRSILGRIFGLSTDNKKSIDTDKYNKGAVPFDGITRKAIVDVIPEHLSRIESLLSGKSQRVYDYHTGKWTNASDIKKKYEEDYASMISDSFSEIKDVFREFTDAMKSQKALDFEGTKNLEKDIALLMKRTVEDEGGYLSPKNIKKNIDMYGFSSDDEVINALLDALGKASPSQLGSVARNTFENKRRYGDRLRDMEEKGDNIFRKIFDNSELNGHLVFDKTFKDKINGVDSIGVATPKDKLGNTSLDYLGDIARNIRYIREYGLSIISAGRGKKGSYIPKNQRKSFDDFETEYKSTYLSKLNKDESDKLSKDENYFNQNYYKDDVDLNGTLLGAIFNVTKNSDIDEDDIEKFKDDDKYYKAGKYSKTVAAIPGKTTLEKFKNAKTFKDKYAVISDSLHNMTRKPAEILTGVIDKAQDSIYEWLFTADTDEFDEEEGKDIKGNMQAMMYKFQAYATELLNRFTDNVLDPIAKKLGLNDKWDKFKNYAKNTNIGQGILNAKNSLVSSLKNNTSGIGNFIRESLEYTTAPIINDPLIANTRIGSNNKKINKIDELLNNASDEELANIDLSKLPRGYVSNKLLIKIQQAKANLKKSKMQDIFNQNKSKFNDKDKEYLKSQGIDTKAFGGIVSKKSGGVNKNKDGLNVTVTNDNETVYVANNETDPDKIDKNYKKEQDLTKALSKKYDLEMKNKEIENNKKDTGPVTIVTTALYQEGKNIADKVMGLYGSNKEKEEQIKKQKDSLMSKLGNILGEMKGSGYDVAAKSILGGGLGLLTGIVGGPLIGAGLGAAMSLTTNSNTVQKFLFGEINEETGEFNKGLISKKTQDTFKKYFPDASKYGVTGAVASLILPFGPLVGAALGAGVGLAKNSETMNEMLFGDEKGLFNKDRRDKIKDYFPKAAAGAVAGLFLGPFGIMGNAALGAGVGLLTGTDEFKNLIFGEPDESGNRYGGIEGALKEHFINPLKDFGLDFKDNFFEMLRVNMIEPLNEAITPLTHEIAYQTKKVVFGIPKFFAKLAEDKIGAPLMANINDKLVEPILGLAKGGLRRTSKLAQTVAFSPFKGVRSLSRRARAKQINRGDANYMGAEEQLQFMQEMGKDDYDTKEQLETMVGMSDDDINESLRLLQGTVNGMDFFDKKISKNNRQLGNLISSNFKEGKIGGGAAGKIRRALNKGNLSEASDLLYDLKNRGRISSDEFSKYTKQINELAAETQKLKMQKSGLNKFLNGDGEIDETTAIEELNKKGFNIKNKNDLKRLMKNFQGESKYRTKKQIGDPTSKVFRENLSEDGQAVTGWLEKIFNVISGAKESAEVGGTEGASKADIDRFNIEKDLAIQNQKAQEDKKKAIVNARVKELKTLGLGDVFDDKVIKLLENNDIYNITKDAARRGVYLTKSNIVTLGKLDKKQIKLLLKKPNLAALDEKSIRRYVNPNSFLTGLSTRKNQNDISKGLEAGIDLSSLDKISEFLERGPKKNPKQQRIEYFQKFKEIGLLGKYGITQSFIMTAPFRNLDLILKDPKGWVSQYAKDNNLNLDEKELESLGEGADYIGNSASSGIRGTINNIARKTKAFFTENGVINYVRNKRGDWTMSHDSTTKETLEKNNEEEENQNKILNSLNSMKDGIFGIFNRHKKKDEEEEKEPWYKKLFNFDLGTTTGKLGFGATILGLFTGIGALKNLWDNREPGGVLDTIGSKVGEFVNPVISKIGNWFTNSGEYSGEDQGLQGFLSNHVFPNLFTGTNVVFQQVMPAILKAFIVNIPALVKAGISGIGELLGFGNKNKNDNKLKANSIKSVSGGTISVASTSLGGNAKWLKDTNSQAAQVAENIVKASNDAASLSTGGYANSYEYFGLPDPNKSTTTETSSTNTTTNSISSFANSVGEKVKNTINKTSSSSDDNEQAIIADTVYMYKKDKDGNLVPITMGEVRQGLVSDFYTEEGAHYIYNEATGEYESELGDVGSSKANIPFRLAAVTIRSALTGRKMGIMRIADKINKTKIGKGILKGTDTLLSKTPFVKGFYKTFMKPAGKVVGGASNLGVNIGSKVGYYGDFVSEYVKDGGTMKEAFGVVKDDILGTTTKAASETKVGKAVSKVANSKVGKTILEKTSKIKNNKLVEFVREGLTKIFKLDFIKDKLTQIMKSSGKKVTNNTVVKAINEMIEKLMKSFTQKILGKVGQGAIGKVITKIGAGSATGGLLTLAFIATDLTVGFDQAESILGISEITIIERFIAAVVNAISNELFFGFVDASTIVDWCVDTILPFFNIDTSEFKDRRAETDAEVEEYNKQHGTNYSTEEYLKKDKLTYKISKGWESAKKWVGKTAGNIWNGAKDVGGKIWNGAKDVGGKAVKTAGNIWNGAKDIYNNTLGKAVNATVDKVTEIGSNVFDVAKYAKLVVEDVFADAFAGKNVETEGLVIDDKDPNKDVKRIVYWTVKIPAKLIAGLASVAKSVVDVTIDVVKGVGTVGKGMGTTIGSMLSKSWNADYSWISDNSMDAKTGNGLVDGTSKILNTITKTIMSPVALLSTGIGVTSRTIGDVIGGIISIGSGMGNVVTRVMGAATSGSGTLDAIFTDQDDAKTGNGFVDTTSKIVNSIIKIPLTPIALITQGISKVGNFIGDIVDGFKDLTTLSKKDQKAIDDAKDGKISPFSSDYWKINVSGDDGLVKYFKTFNSFMQKVFNLPGAILGTLNPVNWIANGLGWLGKKLGIVDETVDTSDSEGKLEPDKKENKKDSGKGSGKTFVSQLDPLYRNQKFNRAGDTELQTIGDSGCAPATAANVLNLYTGKGSVMDNASKAALKYKDRNGGVTPNYFENYLGSKGIGTYSTTNKNEILNGISSGQPTILLGSDPTNRANTPYGSSSSHYVLATGLDGKGNVIVQDPESRKPNALYPMKDLINQSHLGMITGRGTRGKNTYTKSKLGLTKLGFGKGSPEHQDLATWSQLSDAEIDAFIKRKRSDCPFTGAMINKAAAASGLDPRYILAHAAVESAWGTSNQGRKYHNYFGIGAFDSNPDNAKNYSNGGVEAGLVNGAVWIRQNYYDRGQKTVYTMRYNNGSHEYCTSNTWVKSIASIMSNMPTNTNAQYHEANGSISTDSSSGENKISTFFDMIGALPEAYYGKELLSLFGYSSSDSSSSSGSSGTIGAGVEGAAAQMEAWANDPNVGYDQVYRLGERGDYDCSGAVTMAYEKAGIPVRSQGGANATGNMLQGFLKTGFTDVASQVNLSTGDGMQRGDVLLKSGHTAMYIGDGKEAEASINEKGGTRGGQPGDQTGKEFLISNYKNKSWRNVLRYTGNGSGTKNKHPKYLSDIYSISGRGTESLNTNISNMINSNRRISTGNTILPSLESRRYTNTGSYQYETSLTNTSSESRVEKLLSVILEVLQVIANNSGKLSEIVSLLSRALDVELTDNDISKLSSGNAQIKNKIANALKAQGSSTGMGNELMNASTESLASAMYAIARA